MVSWSAYWPEAHNGLSIPPPLSSLIPLIAPYYRSLRPLERADYEPGYTMRTYSQKLIHNTRINIDPNAANYLYWQGNREIYWRMAQMTLAWLTYEVYEVLFVCST